MLKKRMIFGIILASLMMSCSFLPSSENDSAPKPDCLLYRPIYAKDAIEAAKIPPQVAIQIETFNKIYESRCNK